VLPDPGTPVAYQTLEDSRALRVFGPSVRVFRDGADWRAFWSTHVSAVDGEGNSLPPPTIAFDQEMLIAVFWGSHGSGCGNLVDAIDSIMRYDDRLEVHVEALPSLGPCTALVEPLQVVVVEQTHEPVVFTGMVP